MFPNHGVISKGLLGIGEDDDALYCVTDDMSPAVEHHPVLIAVELQTHLSLLLVMVAVVMDEETGTSRMVMYLPSGTDPASPFRWYERWLTGAVLANFRGTANQGTGELNRCDIRDSTGTLHQFYTCVYDEHGFM